MNVRLGTESKYHSICFLSLKIIFGLTNNVLIDFSLTVKPATLMTISGRSSAISSATDGKLGFIYNLVKS